MPKYKFGETIYFIKEEKVVSGRIFGLIYVTESGTKGGSIYYTTEPLDRFHQLYLHNCIKEDRAFLTKEDLLKSL